MFIVGVLHEFIWFCVRIDIGYEFIPVLCAVVAEARNFEINVPNVEVVILALGKPAFDIVPNPFVLVNLTNLVESIETAIVIA